MNYALDLPKYFILSCFRLKLRCVYPAKRGKPSQLFGQEEKIKEMVVEHPDYTLAEYCEYWQDKTGVRLSESAMCRFLHKQKLTVKKNHTQQPSR